MAEYYLVHHGIKGQKWGVRRYQNPDGSLTTAGERRYYTAKDYQRALNKTDKQFVRARYDYDKDLAKSNKYAKKSAKAKEKGYSEKSKKYAGISKSYKEAAGKHESDAWKYFAQEAVLTKEIQRKKDYVMKSYKTYRNVNTLPEHAINTIVNAASIAGATSVGLPFAPITFGRYADGIKYKVKKKR